MLSYPNKYLTDSMILSCQVKYPNSCKSHRKYNKRAITYYLKNPWWINNTGWSIKCWWVSVRNGFPIMRRNLRPSLFHKLWLITKISNTQLPLVEWVLIYLLIHFLREVLSSELASMRDTRE